jgi:hypothetical protein
VLQKELKVFPSLPMFDEKKDNMSPNIDRNSSPKEQVMNKQGKHLSILRKYEAI